MCGRFTVRTSAKALARAFDAALSPSLFDTEPRYNIAPTQPVPVVRFSPEQAGRELSLLRWGLIPFWAKDAKIGYSTINARAETVATKPAFRRPFDRQRCLVLADGYYEWQKREKDRKQPFLIHFNDDRPFAFAGLWDRWLDGDTTIESCTIIVTEANHDLATIHDRMPVILESDEYDRWLDPEFHDAKQLQAMLRPLADEDLEAVAVSNVVNNARNNLPECVRPISIDDER